MHECSDEGRKFPILGIRGEADKLYSENVRSGLANPRTSPKLAEGNGSINVSNSGVTSLIPRLSAEASA